MESHAGIERISAAARIEMVCLFTDGNGSLMKVDSLTSLSLLDKAKRNQPGAWERMARVYGPLVYRWCREGGLRPEDAADVVQEVFRSLIGAIDRFDEKRVDGRFRSWLYEVTRHRMLDHFRRERAEPAATGGSTANVRLQELPAWSDELSGQMAVRSLALRALQIIEKDFETKTWQAFWKVAIDGHAPQHAANELGMSLAAVYKARSRILQRLREELGEQSS